MIASIKSGHEMLGCLADLFSTIEMLLDTEDLYNHEAKSLTGLGKFAAKNYSKRLGGEFKKLDRCIKLPADNCEKNDIRM
ncbi:MAG: hypothetical protein FWD51_03315 [Betaproteobacteria bacterium]|nr:hypothetical protein [Betaproteobacteria bacterium]